MDVVAGGSRQSALTPIIEKKCADCRQRLQICGFLNPPWREATISSFDLHWAADSQIVRKIPEVAAKTEEDRL